MNVAIILRLCFPDETKYSRLDKVNFVEDSFKNLKGYGLLK